MYFGKTQNARPGRVFNDDVEWAGIIGCRADLAGLERTSFMMGLPIKISPKMVFAFVTDSLGRDNLNDPIWVI